MAVRKKSQRKTRAGGIEPDSGFLLKLAAYLIAGSLWLRISKGGGELSLPMGFIVGLVFTRHERFQIDRKIEYAILLMAMFLGFWLVPGITFVW